MTTNNNPFHELHERSARRRELQDTVVKMIASGATQSSVLRHLKQAPVETLDASNPISELAAYGMLKAYDFMLKREMAKVEERAADCLAKGQSNTSGYYFGGKAATPETVAIRHLVDHLAHGISAATNSNLCRYAGRTPIKESVATANAAKALDLVLPYAQKFNVDMEEAFPAYSFVALHNYRMVSVLQKVSPSGFENSHRHAEWRALDGDQRTDLYFYDDFMFQLNKGEDVSQIEHRFGGSIWPADSALEKMRSAYFAAAQAGDAEGATAAFNGQPLRASHCTHFARHADKCPQLVLPLYDATTAFNKQALAGRLLSDVMPGFFAVKEGAVPDLAKDAAALAIVDGLQQRGGDINHGNFGLVIGVAHMGRMDIVRELAARGASLGGAAAYAAGVCYTDESGGNAEYPYADAAKKLANLARSLKRAAAKPPAAA